MMEDRIADRWLRRRFSVLCWTVVIYELLLNILCAVAISTDALRQILQAMQAGDFSGIIDEEQLLQNGWGYVATFAVGLVILYGWKGRDFFRSDRKKAGSMSAGAFFACVSIMLGIQYVFILWTELVDMVMGFFGGSVGEMMEAASLPANSFSIVLYSALLAPISEELLFRKLVQGNLMPFWKTVCHSYIGAAVRPVPRKLSEDSLCVCYGPDFGLCGSGIFRMVVHCSARLQ